MVGRQNRTARSTSIAAATIILGISWSFALFHIRTTAYPLLWSAAMPLLAFYYFSGEQRTGIWKHLPAAALSIYAVVLWQVSRGYGTAGTVATAMGVLASVAAVWFGGRATRAAAVTPVRSRSSSAVRYPPAAASLGSGVARRRRLRSAGVR